jgi:hypothetical protein
LRRAEGERIYLRRRLKKEKKWSNSDNLDFLRYNIWYNCSNFKSQIAMPEGGIKDE